MPSYPQNPYEEENPWAQPKQGAQPNWGGNTGTGTNASVAQGQQAYSQGQRGSDPSQVPGYQDMNAWRQWYGQQQGGQRPEDMARFSDQTLAGWDPWLVKEGQYAGKYRSMRGSEGYYDKPTECPPGMMPSGPNEDDPCVPNGQAGAGGGGGAGGPGGGGGGGRGGGGYGAGWDNPIFNYLRTSGLDAAKDPDAALKVYMGQGGATGWQQQMDAARARAEALPAGPARDAAIADLEKFRAEGLRGMRQSSAAAARGDLQGMLSPELSYNQLGENARQANMQNALGWGGLDVQRMLGMGGLDLQNRMFGWESGSKWQDQLRQQQLDRDLQLRLSQMGQPSGVQKGLDTAGKVVAIGGTIAALA